MKTLRHPCLYLFGVGMWRRVSGLLNVAGGGRVVCGVAERVWNSCGICLQRLGGVALSEGKWLWEEFRGGGIAAYMVIR